MIIREMPLPKLRCKLHHRLKSIVWILDNSKSEVERDRRKEKKMGELSRKISIPMDSDSVPLVFFCSS